MFFKCKLLYNLYLLIAIVVLRKEVRKFYLRFTHVEFLMHLNNLERHF